MKQRLSLLWMLLLCFVAGAWADTTVLSSPSGSVSTLTDPNAIITITDAKSTGIQAGSGSFSYGTDLSATPMKLSGSRQFDLAYASSATITKVTLYGTSNGSDAATLGVSSSDRTSLGTLPSKGSTPVAIDITGKTGLNASAQFLAIIVVEYSSTAPVLKATPDALAFATNPNHTSMTQTFTITGKNLTDGTYSLTIPNLAGLTVEPQSFTVASGAANQEISVTYASTADVAKASTSIVATVDELSATVNLTYQSRAEAYTQTTVSADATWDWSKLTETIDLTDDTYPTKTQEFLLADLDDRINFVADFGDPKAIVMQNIQRPSNAGSAQGTYIKFKTSVPGTLAVDFSNTGGGDRPARYLNVNGVNTTFSSNSTSKVSATGIEVPAGEVVLMGNMVDDTAEGGFVPNQLRFYKITFTASEAPATTYPIEATVSPAEALTFDYTPKEAAEGESVTVQLINPVFGEGYSAADLLTATYSLKTESGDDVPYTLNALNLTMSFTMPAEKVIASFTFAEKIIPAADIVINPADITDGNITAAIAAKAAGAPVNNLTITLGPDGDYNVTAPIEAGGSITINGAENATIDASALEGNFVQMTAVENPIEWTPADVTFKDLTIKGLKKALFYSTCKNYIAENFIIDNCVVEQAGDATTIDYTKGSTAKNFTVTNSTFYAPTATTKSFYSSQGGQKYNEYDTAADAMQTFKFTNNTMYNLAPTKNFFSHRQNSQKWLTFDVKNNIFVNCGKSGQTIKGMNGGGSSANPVWDVDGNAFNFDGADTSAAESTGDDAEPVQNSLAGVFAFTDAANGDFNGIFKGQTAEAPAKYPGDPRWTYTYEIAPTDIVINAEDITDGNITAAITAKTEGVAKVGDITINLAAGDYTISTSIVAPASFTLNGNGATIDASALDAAMITTPTGDLAEWMEGNFTVKDVTVKGLTKAFYASAGKNYLYNDFLIQNCVIELAGTAGNDFDFRKGGVAKNFTIDQSTIYAPAATTNSLYTSQSAQRGTEAPGVTMQTFSITNSTLYNVAKTKNFFTHRQANQTWLAYTIKNSVFLNVGKSGQVVKGINQGQSGANPTWDIEGNVFNFDGADTSAAESTGDEAEPVTGSIAGIVTFTDAANGDFNGSILLAPEVTSVPEQMGDPRWTLTTAAGYNITISDEIANGTVTADKAFAAEGDEITLTITPAEGYELDAITVTGVTSDIAVIVTDGKFTMPADAVSVNATFKEATPTAINGINADAAADNDAPAYNLAGQKVGKGFKGIVIKNGRKVVIK